MSTDAISTRQQLAIDQESAGDEKDANTLEVAGHFVQAALHEAFESPVNGFTQLVNRTTDAQLPEVNIIGAPPPPKAGSFDEAAQMTGRVVGMILPFIVLRKTVGKAMPATAQVLGRGSVAFSNPIAQAAVTGAIYDGVFRPVDDSLSTTDFWTARAKNATVGSITFGALEGLQLGIRNTAVSRGLVTAEGGMSIPLGRFGAPGAKMYIAPELAKISEAAVAGYGAGHVSAQTHSLLHEGRLADLETSHKTGGQFATFGALMSVAHMGLESNYVKGKIDAGKRYFARPGDQPQEATIVYRSVRADGVQSELERARVLEPESARAVEPESGRAPEPDSLKLTESKTPRTAESRVTLVDGRLDHVTQIGDRMVRIKETKTFGEAHRRIYDEQFPPAEAESPASLQASLNEGNARLFSVYDKATNELLAFSFLERYPSADPGQPGFLLHAYLAVKPGLEGNGIGSRLVRDMVSAIKQDPQVIEGKYGALITETDALELAVDNSQVALRDRFYNRLDMPATDGIKYELPYFQPESQDAYVPQSRLVEMNDGKTMPADLRIVPLNGEPVTGSRLRNWIERLWTEGYEVDPRTDGPWMESRLNIIEPDRVYVE